MGWYGILLFGLTLLALSCANETRRLLRRRTGTDSAAEIAAKLLEPSSPLNYEENVWRVWSTTNRNGQPVNPIRHTVSTTKCRWAPLVPPPTPGLSLPDNGTICLRDSEDLLCDAIRRDHYWSECADLPALYALSESSTVTGGLFLDVGANVGACSMHMLLSSNALVLAFEPGADNLFYASSSFLKLSESNPDVHSRLSLYPLAAGSTNSTSKLFSAVGNAGHSVIDHTPPLYAPRGHERAQQIVVRALDEVLWPRAERGHPPHPIALLKLDVEGCGR